MKVFQCYKEFEPHMNTYSYVFWSLMFEGHNICNARLHTPTTKKWWGSKRSKRSLLCVFLSLSKVFWPQQTSWRLSETNNCERAKKDRHFEHIKCCHKKCWATYEEKKNGHRSLLKSPNSAICHTGFLKGNDIYFKFFT